MPNEPCTPELHDELKSDPIRLRAATAPGGIQLDEKGDELFEWRTCLGCKSSIAAPVAEGVPIHVDE